ncbi:serine hydrolase [Lactococcus termiticola]|nr:serine hydrolase [Lactococcus termiticola]
MKKFTLYLMLGLTLLASFNFVQPVKADTPKIPAKAAMAIDASSGKILFAQNATTPLGIASITKNITAYLVLKAIDEKKLSWDEQVGISDYAFKMAQNAETSNIAISQPNSKYSVRDLFNAMMIQSADSAAVALAEKVGGSEPKFVDMMKQQLKDWGIRDAKIVNASGLPNSLLDGHLYPGTKDDDENLMSAQDVALVAQHLIKDYPDVLNTTKMTTAVFNKGGADEQNLHTYNYMLEGYQDYRTGVDGLKTGTTTLAGACFVGTTYQNNFRIITVILNADNADSNQYARFDATNTLMNYVYGNWAVDDIADEGQSLDDFDKLPVFDGKSKSVDLVASKDVSPVVPMANGTADNSKLSVTFDKSKDAELEAPIKENSPQVTATFSIKDDLGYLPGFKGSQFSLVAKQNVEKQNVFTVAWNHFVRFVNEKL